MRCRHSLFAIFVLVHYAAGDRVASYDGQDTATITNLIQQTGNSFEFITAQQFQDFVAAHPPADLTPTVGLVRTQANTSIASGTDSGAELQRAVLLTILDQLNIIRAALPTPLSAITPAQAKAAVAAKINSGAAD